MSNGELKRRSKWNWGRILRWVGLASGVIGTVAAIIAILPTRREKCGETDFLAEQAYDTLSRNFSSVPQHQPQVIPEGMLYTRHGEPKDAGDVLIELNPELSSLYQHLRDGQPFAPGKMVFIYGGGGTGKSAVVNRLKEAHAETAFMDVGEQFKYEQQSETLNQDTYLKDQLLIDGRIISQMPALKDDVLVEGLVSLFKAGGSNKSLMQSTNIIIDSLDELHPVSGIRIIVVAMRYLQENPNKNVVLTARGETFRRYFEHENLSQKNFRPIHIKPVYVGSEPLLTWFVWQALQYEHKINDQAGILPSRETAKQVVVKLESLWQTQPALKQFMFTLAPANHLIKHVNEGYSQDTLTKLLFEETARRNRDGHYRPTQSDAAAWDVYFNALIQVARVASLEPDGTFVFPVQQSVDVRVNNKCAKVVAADVLNFSELIDLEPFNKTHLIYTFYPRPYHKYLAKQKSN